MSILLGVVALFAVLSAVIAAGQAVAICRLAPPSGWRDWAFGWWRFDAIEARAGLSGEVQAAIYKRAVIACIAFVILGLILSGWAANQRPAGTASLAPQKINDWRVLPARYADNLMLRPAAPLPGAALLES